VNFALGAAAFVIALLISVMLHEAGHFLTARHYGMKATQFFVGFGPTVFSRTRGETEYGIKAIPAGGFVKIIGMTSLEPVEPGDEDRAFYKQPAGRKTVVLAAGSTVHFLICIVLVFLTVATYGSTKEGLPKLAAISSCVVDDPAATCTAADGQAPAQLAGLKKGDVLVSVGGKKLTGGEALTKALQASPGTPIALTVRRSGKEQVIMVTPKAVTRPKATKVTGAIGVSVQNTYFQQHYGVIGTFKETGSTLGLFITGTYDSLTKKLGTVSKLYSNDRDPAGLVGVYGAGRVSGDIANAPIPFRDKAASLVLLIASLNLFVGIFNLLPLLPLDGGHIAVVLFEQIRDRLRRLRGFTGEIKRVDMNKLLPVTFAVVVVFASLTVFILGADIVNPIKLGQ
jgi:membrane-associated protease RseP (regulator of RpoE activity)